MTTKAMRPAVAARPTRKTGKRQTAVASGRTGELLAELQRAAQTSTTDGILFHQAVADRVGLGTTGAVTRMVDRLERAGYVRRQADPRDRRRVIIQPVGERLATIASHYRGMATAWNELLAAYGDEQLTLFLDLFDRMHQMARQQLASLDQDTPGPDTATS